MTDLNLRKIAIIGAGNLGIAIAEGLVASSLLKANQIVLTRRNLAALKVQEEKGFVISSDNVQATQWADIVFVCVKPKQAKETIQEISSALKLDHHILISVITGISLADMLAAAKIDVPMFRAMPNTAIAIRESMTFLASSKSAKAEEANVVEIFNQLGSVLSIEEDYMAAATVLGSCGIAYALRYMRAATEGGVEVGFNAETSLRIAAQTVKGAAALLLVNGKHPEYEIDKVTTPMGITITGLNEMEHNGFSSSVIKGITKSHQKMTVK